MTAASLLGLDRLLVMLVAGLWGAAAGYTLAARGTPRLSRGAAALVIAALAATVARAVVAVLLARHSWWFAGEKLLLVLPLLLVPAMLAAARSIRSPVQAWPVLSAAYAAVAGLVVALGVGFPASPYVVAVIVAAWAAGTLATWFMLAGKGPRGRAWRVAGSAVLAVALAWTGLSLWNTRPPDDLVLAARGNIDVSTLRGTAAGPVKRFTLTAGQTAEGRLTFNGTSPGPTLRVTRGDTVEVSLRNELPDRGVTLHWHGYHVPNGEDGVPGLTQDAVTKGGTFVYRFPASQTGTYWYHTHETPNLALQRGLFGAFIVDQAPPQGVDEPVFLHTFDGAVTLPAGRTVEPGSAVRLRVINTDNGPHLLGLSGTPYRIAAVDGIGVNGRELTGERAQLAAGGRYDLTFTMPEGPVLLTADSASFPLTPRAGDRLPGPAAGELIDITQYGERTAQGPARFDRDYTWVLDKLITPRGGLPRLSHTVNGQVWPRIPAAIVREGEWVRFTVVNRSGDLHPMHPHGHHVLVLSRNGVRAAPIWMDSFDVAPGEVWEVALQAGNPGLWLAHCHELKHAAEGMTLHFAYEGVRSPYAVGDTHGNHPE